MNRRNDDEALSGWHLDKRVPIALIATILIQTATALWWAAKVDERVVQLEQARTVAGDQPIRIVRVETQMEDVRETLKLMNEKLDRLLGHPAPGH